MMRDGVQSGCVCCPPAWTGGGVLIGEPVIGSQTAAGVYGTRGEVVVVYWPDFVSVEAKGKMSAVCFKVTLQDWNNS